MSELKIIQVIPMENNASWQGAILGLGNDGVVYEFSVTVQKWIVCLPLEFDREDKTESTELQKLRKERDELERLADNLLLKCVECDSDVADSDAWHQLERKLKFNQQGE